MKKFLATLSVLASVVAGALAFSPAVVAGASSAPAQAQTAQAKGTILVYHVYEGNDQAFQIGCYGDPNQYWLQKGQDSIGKGNCTFASTMDIGDAFNITCRNRMNTTQRFTIDGRANGPTFIPVQTNSWWDCWDNKVR